MNIFDFQIRFFDVELAAPIKKIFDIMKKSNFIFWKRNIELTRKYNNNTIIMIWFIYEAVHSTNCEKRKNN